METLAYDFCKLALCDGYTKRYLKSYVASSLLITAFEMHIDLILRDAENKLRYDTNQVAVIGRILEKVFSKYFGYNKYVFFQFIGKFLVNRFRCFFYQYSGILTQQKQQIMSGQEVDRGQAILLLKREYADVPYLLKDRLIKHLFDHETKISFEPFFKDFLPEMPIMPLAGFTWGCSIDLFSSSNDEKFHKHLTSILKQVDYVHFRQLKELQEMVQRET